MMRFVWMVPICLYLHKYLYQYTPFIFPEGISIHNKSSYETLEGINETELYLLVDEIIIDTLENKTTWEELMRFGISES